jgi:Mrp family chromosome partitioning ATPase
MGADMDNNVSTRFRQVPANYGPLQGAIGNARKMGPSGETMEFWVKGNVDKIDGISFISDGDEDAVRVASLIASMAEGMVPIDVKSLGEKDIVKSLDAYSHGTRAIVALALEALKSALDDLEVKAERAVKRQVKDDPDRSKSDNTPAGKRRTIMVMSGKGGVGKSTVAVNLALSLSAKGFKVGLVDVDIHGPSIPTMLNLPNVTVMNAADGIQPVILGDMYNLEVMSIGFLLHHPDDPVVWRGPLKNSLIEQFLNDVAWGPLDYLIIDCPPGTGDEPLSVAQQLKEKAEAVLVTTPQDVATVDVSRSINFCRQMSMPVVGLVENMSGFVCPHCHTTTDIFRTGGGKKLADKYDVEFLGSIPIDPSFGITGDAGIPYVQRFTDSPVAETYRTIATKLHETRSTKV